MLWSWDVVERLKSLSEEELATVRRSVSDPRLALHVAMATSKDETEIKRCKDELMSQHLSDSLRRWVEWSEREKEQGSQTINENSSSE